MQASRKRRLQAEEGDWPSLPMVLSVATICGTLPPAIAALPALLAWIGATLPSSSLWWSGGVLLIGIPASAWISYRFTATREGAERDDIVLALVWTATTYLFFAGAAVAVTVGVAFSGFAS